MAWPVVLRLLPSLGSAARRRSGCCFGASLGCAACLACVVAAVAGLLAALLSAAGPLRGSAASAFRPGPSAPLRCAGISASQGYGFTTYQHTGIDLVCPPGTPVLAVAAGVVHRRSDDTASRCPPGLGPGLHGGLGAYAIVATPAGTSFVYAHLRGFAVPDGTVVMPGMVLGFEGASGCATGEHLHFEVRVDGRAVNPCPYLPDGYPAAHNATGDRCWGDVAP